MKKHTSGEAGTQQWSDRFGESIYAVNPDIPIDVLLQEATCVVDALAEIAGKGTDAPISAAQARLLESELRKVQAILNCAESQVFHAQHQRAAA